MTTVLDWIAFFLLGHKYPRGIQKWAQDRVINWICTQASGAFE